MRCLIVLFCSVCVLASVCVSEKVILCYYGTWATYRPGLGKFDVENINPYLCTHVVYSFVGINNDGTIKFLDPFLDLADNWGRNNIGKLNALKVKNPNLKTILAVGGWSEGSAKYSVMAASPELRRNFVNSATETVLKFGFDGFDVDWEYPNGRDSVHGWADIDNFTQVLKELRESFDKYGLMLSAAVSAAPIAAARSYDIAGISKYVDYIGLMTYDFSGAWDRVTGHNAGLFRGIGDENTPETMLYTVDVSVRYWLDNGCPPEKLLIGIPFYGRTFTLASPSASTVRSPSVGAGSAGLITQEAGILGYNEICTSFQSGAWDLNYDPLAQVPYAVNGRDWITYDDPNSIQNKIEYGKQFNITGVIVWSIETDDFRGLCQHEDYPLLRSINNAFKRDTDATTTTTTTKPSTTTSTTFKTSTTTRKPSSTTTFASIESESSEEASTTSSPTSRSPKTTSVATSSTTPITTFSTSTTEAPWNFECSEEGQTPNPHDCASFFVCTKDGNNNLIPQKIHCPSDLYYDYHYQICNFKDLVDCQV